eukprot:9989467-Prorocentrum_lima.AAC.1
MEPKMVNGIYLGPTLRVGSNFNKASHVARLDAFRGGQIYALGRSSTTMSMLTSLRSYTATWVKN